MAAMVRLTTAEKIYAYSLIVNGLVGFVLMTMLVAASILSGSFSPETVDVVVLPIVGICSGAFALKGKSLPFVTGLVFYAVQTIRYYSPAFSLGFSSGFQFGAVLPWPPAGTLVINVLAIGFTLFGIFILTERFFGDT